MIRRLVERAAVLWLVALAEVGSRLLHLPFEDDDPC